MNDKIQILLPVHNRREVTRRFVECLKRQTHQRYHLLLIDDGSRDGTAQMVREEIPATTVLTGTGDWWWAGSLQKGYLWLQEQVHDPATPILIINDDTEFAPDFLESALGLLRQRKRTLLLARCYSRRDGRLMDAGVHVDWRRWSHRQAGGVDEINCLSTRGLFLRLEDFQLIGGFRPRLLPHYFSDYEFTIRARRKGLRLATDPALTLRVDEDQSGHRKIGRAPLVAGLRELFSNRSVLNPIHSLAYVALASPWRWKLPNATRVLFEGAANVARVVVGSFRRR